MKGKSAHLAAGDYRWMWAKTSLIRGKNRPPWKEKKTIDTSSQLRRSIAEASREKTHRKACCVQGVMNRGRGESVD